MEVKFEKLEKGECGEPYEIQTRVYSVLDNFMELKKEIIRLRRRVYSLEKKSRNKWKSSRSR